MREAPVAGLGHVERAELAQASVIGDDEAAAAKLRGRGMQAIGELRPRAGADRCGLDQDVARERHERDERIAGQEVEIGVPKERVAGPHRAGQELAQGQLARRKRELAALSESEEPRLSAYLDTNVLIRMMERTDARADEAARRQGRVQR